LIANSTIGQQRSNPAPSWVLEATPSYWS